MDLYALAQKKATEIEIELKRLSLWSENLLPPDCFENMGAFGSNTMRFEQWLQFVLLPRINQIIQDHEQFPSNSQVAVYAIRYFDGNPATEKLQGIISEFDELFQNTSLNQPNTSINSAPTVHIGDEEIPEVLYAQAEVLPQFDLQNLESQLQTFDTFLGFLSPNTRPAISALLLKAAEQTKKSDCKKRIEQAAKDILDGKRAAAPYNHEQAMEKYRKEHEKNYPSNR
jgi:uncharacterized protein YqcC (DUF446 family)